jgi:hypothetical protein
MEESMNDSSSEEDTSMELEMTDLNRRNSGSKLSSSGNLYVDDGADVDIGLSALIAAPRNRSTTGSKKERRLRLPKNISQNDKGFLTRWAPLPPFLLSLFLTPPPPPFPLRYLKEEYDIFPIKTVAPLLVLFTLLAALPMARSFVPCPSGWYIFLTLVPPPLVCMSILLNRIHKQRKLTPPLHLEEFLILPGDLRLSGTNLFKYDRASAKRASCSGAPTSCFFCASGAGVEHRASAKKASGSGPQAICCCCSFVLASLAKKELAAAAHQRCFCARFARLPPSPPYPHLPR